MPTEPRSSGGRCAGWFGPAPEECLQLPRADEISDGLFRVENDREYDLLLRWLGKQWPRRSTPTSVHVFDVGADRAMPVHFWQVPTGL